MKGECEVEILWLEACALASILSVRPDPREVEHKCDGPVSLSDHGSPQSSEIDCQECKSGPMSYSPRRMKMNLLSARSEVLGLRFPTWTGARSRLAGGVQETGGQVSRRVSTHRFVIYTVKEILVLCAVLQVLLSVADSDVVGVYHARCFARTK